MSAEMFEDGCAVAEMFEDRCAVAESSVKKDERVKVKIFSEEERKRKQKKIRKQEEKIYTARVNVSNQFTELFDFGIEENIEGTRLELCSKVVMFLRCFGFDDPTKKWKQVSLLGKESLNYLSKTIFKDGRRFDVMVEVSTEVEWYDW